MYAIFANFVQTNPTVKKMEFQQLEIDGLWLITPRRFGDARGYFMESFKASEFEAHIGPVSFVQDNESVSTRGVLRGMHLQTGRYAQAKLVRVSQGRVFDVAVDLRPDSLTRGRWYGIELSAENARQLYIPPGFAHGFLVLSDVAQFQYKVDNIYAPQSEMSLRYDDPTVGIEWPAVDAPVLLSPKDEVALPYQDVSQALGRCND